MKKCYYFPTWEEKKDVMISLDNEEIFFKERTSFYSPIDGNITITYEITEQFKQSTLSDPILAKLCELTGAKMYDDYIVLKPEKNIYYCKSKKIVENLLNFKDKIIKEEYDFSNYQKELTDIFLNDNKENVVKLAWYPYSTINHNIQKLNKEELKEYLEKEEYNIELLNKKVCGINQLKQLTISIFDLFQEYSRFLRGEENKFKEIAENLDIKL
jgi:hypothetical protein